MMSLVTLSALSDMGGQMAGIHYNVDHSTTLSHPIVQLITKQLMMIFEFQCVLQCIATYSAVWWTLELLPASTW